VFVRRSKALSTSDDNKGNVAPVTCSAASRVQPPRKTDNCF
jgi:hypothetical protein